MSEQRVRHRAPQRFQRVSAGCKCQLLAPPQRSRHSQNRPSRAECDPAAQQQLCAAVQALLALHTVRVLAPERTSYFHVMDGEENAFACGEGMWMEGWGWQWGWQGRQELGCGTGQGGRLPGKGLCWARAVLGRKNCCVGVLVHEDVELGSVLKQKALIFSFEMAFLLSWSMK